MTKKIAALFADFIAVVRSFFMWIIEYVKIESHKNIMGEYCHVCQSFERPLQLGRYMIWTGPRKYVDIDSLPLLFDIYVCPEHHPDSHVHEAKLAHETQNLLKKLNVAARCVYFYNNNRQ